MWKEAERMRPVFSASSNILLIDTIGSAEHAILREIRAIVGPYMPIALVMDPHGNLSEELVSNLNLLRCYRHSPHIDTKETYQFMAKDFIDLLNHREDIHPIYYRVP